MSKPVFVECGVCGERFKIATIPMDVTTFCKALMRMCPNCAERKQLFICPTEGEGEVTEA